jgi:aromatic ring-cleaving dioxygenase
MSTTHDVTGFHAHVYFDKATQPAADALRDGLSTALSLAIARSSDVPVGPHTKGQFEVRFATEQLWPVLAFLSRHRGELSVLVHPLTGDHITDHETYPIWLGAPVRIDLELLRQLVA